VAVQEIHGPDPQRTAAHQVHAPREELQRRVVAGGAQVHQADAVAPAPRLHREGARPAAAPHLPHGRARHGGLARVPRPRQEGAKEVWALVLKIADIYWTTMPRSQREYIVHVQYHREQGAIKRAPAQALSSLFVVAGEVVCVVALLIFVIFFFFFP